MLATDQIRECNVPVIQVTSSLDLGGAERVALNLANVLAERGHPSHLCSTRGGTGFLSEVQPAVNLLSLHRTGRFDAGAILRFARYVRENDIGILHCHSTSLFIGAVVNWLSPGTRLLWHDHYGAYATVERPAWLYRLFCTRVSGVIAVNTHLADWAKTRLRIRSDRVWYVPNFVVEEDDSVDVPHLPGVAGNRVVCVANLRAQKDHLNLLRAMESVVQEIPRAHLILLGCSNEGDYSRAVLEAATQGNLSGKVTWLGPRNDVRAILRGCDVGVLSSASEGLPLALLEYGMVGLGSVTTDVGQCAEVLGHGEAGILVPPGDSRALSEALVTVLRSEARRRELGLRLRHRVRELYGEEAAIARIEGIYQMVVKGGTT